MSNVWEEVLQQQEPIEFDQVEEEDIKEEPTSSEVFGLMYVGYLTDTFQVFGSTISIRTLKIGEELEAELLVSKYRGSQEADRAYIAALVAASITSVDGQPLIQGLGPASETLERRYTYIMDNWHWVTIAAIYNRYNALLDKALEALEEVKKN